MAYIVGGVASRTEGFTDLLIGLLPAYLFHAVSMALGTFLVAKSLVKKPTLEPKVPAAA